MAIANFGNLHKGEHVNLLTTSFLGYSAGTAYREKNYPTNRIAKESILCRMSFFFFLDMKIYYSVSIFKFL